MSHGAPIIQIKQRPNLKAVIISASWHPEICDALVAGAKRGLAAAGINAPTIKTVAGSFELPLAAQLAFDEGFDIAVVVTKHDGVATGSIEASKYVFDCTGTIAGVEGI